MLRAAVTAGWQPILLLLPHEPLLLLPEDAAMVLASALVLDTWEDGATCGVVGLFACLAKGMLLTSHLGLQVFNALGIAINPVCA